MKEIILIGLIFISIYACTKQEDCPKHFQVPLQITLIKQQYYVGDTITAISKFSRNVPAYNSEKKEIGTFDMKGIRWRPVSNIYRIDSTENISIVEKYFHFVPDTSFDYAVINYSDSGSGLIGEYNFINDSFYLKFKLVVQTPGLYYSEFGSQNLIGDINQQDFPGKCRNGGFDAWTQMNGGGNNNIDFLNESPNVHFNTWILQDPKGRFHNFGGYCFRVVP